MAFIRTVPPSEAQGPVREMYEEAQSRFGYVPNWTRAFSLRPGVRTNELDPTLRRVLTVGRPVADRPE
jgi:hypothetical protein